VFNDDDNADDNDSVQRSLIFNYNDEYSLVDTLVLDSGATANILNASKVVHDGRESRTKCLNEHTPSGFAINAFDRYTTVPSPSPTPINMIPPVSCIVIPNNQDDANSSVAAPVVEPTDPAGRVPIRIEQEFFAHVDDIICNKTVIDIAGEPANNWTQFVETRRSFPTQVMFNHRILQVNGAAMSLSLDLPNAFLHYHPKRVGVI
jgi:hypothetical protein